MNEIYYLHSKCDFDIQIAEPKEKLVIRGRIFSDIRPVLDKYRTDTVEQYKVVREQNTRFTELIYDRINKIIDETTE